MFSIKCFPKIRALLILILVTLSFANSETVGVFSDATIAQIKFAAEDIKSALEAKGLTVEMLPLTSLSDAYANKKVIVALAANTVVTNLLTNQGGTLPTGLGEQAYALRTTTSKQTSYWVLGGDANGAMYGGLQIAENIKFSAFTGSYNNQEAPSILRRGIKLNLPWDKNSGTYGMTDAAGFEGEGSQNAIGNTWDMSFWTAWFDEMARNRYNTISVWSMHPFTSLVSVPGYEDCAIQNVTLYNGTVLPMTIDQKIVFWKNVMAYAHSRGFEFILFNWNTFAYGAIGKHGIGNDISSATQTYMKASMTKLLETYPDLDGFGVTNGEGTSSLSFLKAAYADPIDAFAKLHQDRKFRFICRSYLSSPAAVASTFGYLRNNPNVTLNTSLKWSSGHMHSTATPTYVTGDIAAIKSNNMKTWLTVRNDDFFYLHWGDPDYVRAYFNFANTQIGNAFEGYYMGGDGYNPTRTFFSKNSVSQGRLEVQRQWYFYKLWGRMGYNPNTPDEVFKNYMSVKFPSVSSENMFNAWKKGSRGPQLMTELIAGSWFYDRHWWPEGQNSHDYGYADIAKIAGLNVTPGSSLCSMGNSASGGCGSKITSYQIADSIQKNATEAMSLLSGMSGGANTELGVNLSDIKLITSLSLYYAEKIRGATYNKAGKKPEAVTAMGNAYCNWMSYINLMDAMFKPTTMQRGTNALGTNWHAQDGLVLKDYTTAGGTGTPTCTVANTWNLASAAKPTMQIYTLTSTALSFQVPANAAYSLEIFSTSGAKVAGTVGKGEVNGINHLTLASPLSKGVYLVELRLQESSWTKQAKLAIQ